MEWLDRMCHTLDYLEDQLEKPLDMDEVAHQACSSTFHFQRMFHMLTGVTVAEYVRKRRLTLAAQELASSNVKVLDVALKYGYDTPESFAKAFRRVHGISPSAAREPETTLKAYPRLAFHYSLKGNQEMDYRIVEKDAFRIIGKGEKITTVDGENFKKVPRFWSDCRADGTCDQLCCLTKDGTLLGVCADFSPDLKEFTYMVAVANKSELPTGMVEMMIPAATWAIFQSVGPIPGAIQQVTERIFSEWFPATGYEHAGAPEIEYYLPGDNSADDYRCEVWIPIMHKK